MPKAESIREPEYWERMGPGDRTKYLVLRERFLKPGHRNQRNHALNKFREALSEVSAFVHEPGANTIDRALVVGFYQMADAFAINVQQFIHIYPKCKSSVNLALKSLGYQICSPRSDAYMEFLQLFPKMKDNFSFTRQWVVRSMGEDSFRKLLHPEIKGLDFEFTSAIPKDLLGVAEDIDLLDDLTPPEFVPHDIYNMSGAFVSTDFPSNIDFYGF